MAIPYMRDGWIEIDGQRFDGLDFRFDIQKTAVYAQFSAGILGLRKIKIDQWAIWSPQLAGDIRRPIKIYAGYKNHGVVSCIADGYITEGLVTSPPEMWFNMQCLHDDTTAKYAPQDFSPYGAYSKQLEGRKLSEICKEICDMLGYEFDPDKDWRAVKVSKDQKSSFDILGKDHEMLYLFGQTYNLCLAMNYDETAGKYRITVDDVASNYAPSGGGAGGQADGRPRLLSIETGLLAIQGKPMITGATARCKLDDSWEINGKVQLDSYLYPKLSGLYQVINKHHVGHFRGDEWYTDLSLIKIDPIVSG